MAKYITHPTPKSGIPLGGIGAGSIELRPDGEFHEWQIANPQKFSVDCRDIRNADKGEGLAGSLSFYLREEQNGSVVLRRLGMGFGSGQGIGEEEYNYRMYSFNKTVEEIEYEAKFPMAQLKYNDGALPLDVRMTACCPFVPYDTETSAAPGIYLTFKIKNISDKAADVSLAGKLKNILPESGRRNRILPAENGAALSMDIPGDTNAGNITLSVSGGEISAIPGDYERYMNEYVSHGEFGVVEESFLFGLRRIGRLPFSAEEGDIIKPEWCGREKFDMLSDSEVEGELDYLRRYGFADSIIERNTATLPELDSTPEGKRRLLRCIYRNGHDIERDGKWGDGALCSSFRLEAGEEKEISFTLAWYFPNLVSSAGRVVGHVYENYFPDSVSVTDFMREKRDYILNSAKSFSENIYNTSYPESFADSVSEQLANLVKSAWWVKDGSFGIWEGLGSCGFHTTDITYHGSFGIITLFPELQKKQMEMGARFQREDGRVHHFFTPDFTTVDDGFDRVDMNPQFVLLVCRDYFATGDKAYLERMWSHVVRAMDSIEKLDSNGDALPDKNASRNTYDAWHFSGTSTYISVLWLASLKAASAMAEIMGEPEKKTHWDLLVETGRAAVEEKLFNGRYYDLWVDEEGEKRVDRCCMTDQLDGEYFARFIGLGGILNDGHVKTALDSIYEINYSAENGLVNAKYPEGEKATVYTYRNCQGLANWSGIEYMMASFYLLLGDYDKGYTVMNTVQERYLRAGEIFNHAECGDHYYRPLSSWGLMQSLGGMRVNVALKQIVFSDKPLRESYNAPWFTAEGYGQVNYDGGIWTVSCVYGSLSADKVYIGNRLTGEKISLKSGECVSVKA